MAKKVIFCNCQGKIIEASRLKETGQLLSAAKIPFTKVTDLCGICATRKEEVKQLFSEQDDTLVFACYPRAVSMVLTHSGAIVKPDQLSVINMRASSMEDIKATIQSLSPGKPEQVTSIEIEGDKEWPAWYPVIDYSRCSSCGQCADFCLFGVYAKTEGNVTVINPKGCKNNCPACARICPQTAIVFPKYEQGGAIAGSDSIDEMAEQQRQLQDVDSILGSDIYKALEIRKLKRRSIISSDEMDKALKEREKAVKDKL
jgi:NAD-dependent dihydropyrimidine dehydrogenase PreA subunit